MLSLIAADAASQIPELTGVLEAVALGLLLGATGQGIRVIVGMKKLYDSAANSNPPKTAVELFDGHQMAISFVIGAVAGMCAVFGLLASKSPFDVRSLLGLVAAGYAGADFIEGFASQWLPGSAQTQQASLNQGLDDARNMNVAGGIGRSKLVSAPRGDDSLERPASQVPDNGKENALPEIPIAAQKAVDATLGTIAASASRSLPISIPQNVLSTAGRI